MNHVIYSIFRFYFICHFYRNIKTGYILYQYKMMKCSSPFESDHHWKFVLKSSYILWHFPVWIKVITLAFFIYLTFSKIIYTIRIRCFFQIILKCKHRIVTVEQLPFKLESIVTNSGTTWIIATCITIRQYGHTWSWESKQYAMFSTKSILLLIWACQVTHTILLLLRRENFE